jgi:acyl-CoA synthetase (AMP-forming)/AMP-acid ligase II
MASAWPSRSRSWGATYRELNETANRLAHMLLRRGGATGDRAAILMQHDGPMIAAIIGVLKAGRIAAIFNPADPAARLRELVNEQPLD